MHTLYYISILSVIILIYTYLQAHWIHHQSHGNEQMQKIAHHIQKGAKTFLKTEYTVLTFFTLIVCIFLYVLTNNNTNSHPLIILSFILGAILSGLSGFIGMSIATKANVRTTQAALKSLRSAFYISFKGGMIMGTSVVSLALLGLCGLLIGLIYYFNGDVSHFLFINNLPLILEVLTGFSLGSESIALFSRVGGGIYTKAADVGADLVGKIESNIPEDDPRNPATIADNVGDNVGDIAGMGADLFGSYVATILAAMILGSQITFSKKFYELPNLVISPVLLPLVISAYGLIACTISCFFIRIQEQKPRIQKSLDLGSFLSIVLTILALYITFQQLPLVSFYLKGTFFTYQHIFYSTCIGLITGILLNYITAYYTSMDKPPVNLIVKQSIVGHSTNIIAGLSVGMLSTVFPMTLFAIAIYVAFDLAGFYGVAMAAVGMMSTTTMQLAIDAFGPIADNAGGIAEMAGLPEEVRNKTDQLDTVGNTTAAIGKGFAIASAALTSLALIIAFVNTTEISAIDVAQAPILAGLFLGSVMPFLFSALTIQSVGKAAMTMVQEVRRQFQTIPGIMDNKVDPNYEKCVYISTKSAIYAMILPSSLAIIAPILVGFLLGVEVLGGFLVGITVTGILMAIFQSNAGGAWDNAKKTFEKGVEIDGVYYKKGSEAHKASITGDTVGDPLKDTSGPSMNILIKLTSIIALILAPHLIEKKTYKMLSGSHQNMYLEEQKFTKTQLDLKKIKWIKTQLIK